MFTHTICFVFLQIHGSLSSPPLSHGNNLILVLKSSYCWLKCGTRSQGIFIYNKNFNDIISNPMLTWSYGNIELSESQGKTYILIGHIPVWPLSIRHHFPHNDSVAPYVTGRREFTIGNCFWCSPPDRNLATLRRFQLWVIS